MGSQKGLPGAAWGAAWAPQWGQQGQQWQTQEWAGSGSAWSAPAAWPAVGSGQSATAGLLASSGCGAAPAAWPGGGGAAASRAASPPAAAAGCSGAGGNAGASVLLLEGCSSAELAPRVAGLYQQAGDHHGCPLYHGGPSGAFIYFWDGQDSAELRGWWIGPRVGGDEGWAMNGECTRAPPSFGWKVPWNGSVDATMRLRARTPADVAAEALKRSSEVALGASSPSPSARPRRPDGDRGDSRSRSKGRSRSRRGDLREERPRRDDLRPQRLTPEESAILEVREVIKCLLTARPEEFDLASSQVEMAIDERREVMGKQPAQRMEWEARDAFRQAKQRLRQESADTVRRSIAALRVATPQTFESLREEVSRHQSSLSEWLSDEKEALEEEFETGLFASQSHVQIVAVANARETMQRLVAAASFEAVEQCKAELEAIMAEQGRHMGCELEAVQDEVAQCLQGVQAQVKQLEERRIVAQREAEKNLHTLRSFTADVNHAEAEALRTTQSLAATLANEGALGAEDAHQAAVLCEEAISAVMKSVDSHRDQCLQIGRSLAAAGPLTLSPAAVLCGLGAVDAQTQLNNLLSRLAAVAATLGEADQSAKAARERTGRIAAAVKMEQEQKDLFYRFCGALGMLGINEVAALASAEYELDQLSDAFLGKIRSAFGLEAINYEKFARLRQMLAMEQTEVKARQKRWEEEERRRREAEEAERRRRELGEIEMRVKALLGGIAGLVPGIAAALAGVEVECSEFLVKSETYNSDELLKAAHETEIALKRPSAALEALRDKIEQVEKVLCPELPRPLAAEATDLRVKFERAQARAARMFLAVSKARERAKDNQEKEERLKEQRDKFAKLQAKYDDNGAEEEDSADDGEWQS